tara:strand:+ start:8211 stop:10199 length:1989 start_codon:yes stop_codon:yes gene_type:complete
MAAETVVIQLKGEDKFSQVYATFNSSSQKIEKQVKSLTQSLLLEGKSVGKTTNQLEIMKLELMGASKAQMEAVRSAQIFRDKQVALAKSSGVVTQQFRFMRGGLGQVGHQVQDIAVQLQMGQNAMLIFGQQGSQIASLFGPHGAILGAFLAVGAALATSFFPSMKKAKEKVKTLSEQIKELNEDLVSITASQANYLMLQHAMEKSKLDEKHKEQKEKLDQLNESYKNATSIVNENATATARTAYEANALARRHKDAQKTINGYSAAQYEMTASLDVTSQELKQNIEEYNELKRRIDGTSYSTESLIESLNKEGLALGQTQRALDLKKASDEGAIQADLDAINAAHDRIDAFDDLIEGIEAEQDALKAQTKAKEKATSAEIKMEEDLAAHIFRLNEKKIAIEKSLADSKKRTIDGFVSGLQDELATLQLSGEALARYKAQKIGAGEATEEAIVSLYAQIDAETQLKKATEESHKAELKRAEDLEASYKKVFDNLGDGFVDAITGAKNFSDAMKSTAKSVVDSLIKMLVQKYIVDAAFGAITARIGQAATNISGGYSATMGDPFSDSFAGGGYTGNGSRSGGLDGKGGFAAILHPRETVVDHHQGQSLGGDGITINQTINVTTGVQQTVRAEIATLMPQIASAAKAAVADAKMRGGNYSKMLGA